MTAEQALRHIAAAHIGVLKSEVKINDDNDPENSTIETLITVGIVEWVPVQIPGMKDWELNLKK